MKHPPETGVLYERRVRGRGTLQARRSPRPVTLVHDPAADRPVCRPPRRHPRRPTLSGSATSRLDSDCGESLGRFFPPDPPVGGESQPLCTGSRAVSGGTADGAPVHRTKDDQWWGGRCRTCRRQDVSEQESQGRCGVGYAGGRGGSRGGPSREGT